MTAEDEQEYLKSKETEGEDVDEDKEDFLICSITKDGKVIIPGRDED